MTKRLKCSLQAEITPAALTDIPLRKYKSWFDILRHIAIFLHNIVPIHLFWAEAYVDL